MHKDIFHEIYRYDLEYRNLNNICYIMYCKTLLILNRKLNVKI